jgi:hypothetical protein
MTALFDNFSGPDNTELAGQTADSGPAWSRQSNSSAADHIQTLGGHAILSATQASGNAYYIANYDPGTPDVTVAGTFVVGTVTNSQSAYVMLRVQADGSHYRVGIGGTGTMSGQYVNSSGVATTLTGTTGFPTFTVAANTTYVYKAQIRGTDVRLWINGILYYIWTDSTISASGKVGVSFTGTTAATATTGIHLDHLDADAAPAIATGPLVCTFDGASDGSSLWNYTTESGHHWERQITYAAATSTAPTIYGGALCKGNSGTEFYVVTDWIPASADYPVEGQFKVRSLNSETFYVAARADEKSTTFYYFGIQNGTTLRLGKNVAGTPTSLGGSPNNSTAYTLGTTGSSTGVNIPVLAVGQTRRLRLEVSGTTLNGYVDDVLCWTVTDSAISAAGRAGVQFLGGAAISDSSTGVVLDSISTSTNAFTLSLEDYRVFQMTSLVANTSIALSGQAPSTATDVQLQVVDASSNVVVAWTVPTGLTWTGTSWAGSISVPKGGWYQLQYRWRISGVVQATYSTTPHFGVGLLLAEVGDSNMYFEYAGGSGTAPALASFKGQTSGTVQQWALLSASPGYGACILAQLLIDEFAVPVGFLNMAQGGSTLGQWSTNSGNYLAILQAQLAKHSPLLGLFSQIGYNDYTVNGVSGGSFTLASMVAAHRSFFSQVRATSGVTGIGGGTLPIFVQGSSPGLTIKAANAPLQCQINREAERIVGDDANNAYIISQADKAFDGTHKYYTSPGWGDHARQMARIISAIVRGVTLPVLQFTNSVAVDATHTDLVVPIGSGSTAITGSSVDVEVGTDGTTWTAVSACSPQTRSGADISAGIQRVRVTHGSLGTGNRYWRYMGAQDAGYGTSGEKQANCLRDDNSTQAMAVLMTKDAVSNRPITIHVVDNVGATADLATQITTFQ